MKPGMFHARVAASAEISAGLGLAVGLLTPIAAAGFVALMLVAAWTVHRANGFFIVRNGWEYNLILAVAAVGTATIGPGTYSLDDALFHDSRFFHLVDGWWGLLMSGALGLAGGIGQLVIFWRLPLRLKPERTAYICDEAGEPNIGALSDRLPARNHGLAGTTGLPGHNMTSRSGC